ncbi:MULTISPECIES: hypothetical protein [unclassified Bradyrhizobium]|uniref:hypothetical protein n=1 Tax=unclassified Bradyrhizobium TaxID=2631580 RepID=UPI001FF7E626|nr:MULTISPECIES: hypothetical protein [unclassified Bradyrhizobium]
MSRIENRLKQAISGLGSKPLDSEAQNVKRRYSERLSECVALAVAAELRERGLKEARPASPGELDSSGAERRMAGGLGAKKVDVTWATEEAGLLLAISIKSINFRDASTKNFQKNLVNRRGDMLMEAVTLHRRFPYAVLGAFFFFNKDAESDGTSKRKSTFLNAHARLRLFTGRADPAGRDEQFERFYILLLDASAASPVRTFEVGKPETPLPLSDIFDELLNITAERNPDFYEFDAGVLRNVR